MNEIEGFDWDHGNWPKCGKHGLSKADIEYVVQGATFRIPDPHPSEPRFRTASRAPNGRVVFIVYVLRERKGLFYLRPLSARYMHEEEVRRYEQFERKLAEQALAEPS